MSINPTPRQLQVLDFLRTHIDAKGFAPSYDEIKATCGFPSKSGVHSVMTRLEARGLIRRKRGQRRSIEIVPPVASAIEQVLRECSLSPNTRAELVALSMGAA